MLVLALVLVVSAGLAGTAPGVGAAAPGRAPDAAVWSARVCRALVGFQAAGLDARDALWAASHADPPTDRAARTAVVRSLTRAIAPVRQQLKDVDRTLARKVPKGRNVAALRDGLRDGMTPVTTAYSGARDAVVHLADVPPRRVPTAVATLQIRLDRAVGRAAKPLTRLERTARKSPIAAAFASTPVCRSIGLDWASVPASDGATRTPPAPAVDEGAPGGADVTAPALLIPGRYRPTTEMTALTAEASMTGLGRVYFYGAAPEVETGSPFVGDCPSADAANSQILGCYHDGRIYILEVTRPELTRIVVVTAAHEMLHAVYDAADAAERTEVDALIAGFYATTTDERLKRIVGQYDRRSPANRATELHSLVPTQVASLTPDLDAYFADYFRDRGPVLAAYDAYISVFEGLIARYDALVAEVEGLRDQILGLRGQSDTAAREADRLASQIDSLRAQGRFDESNGLVPAQNDAVRRAQGFNAQSNVLVDQHNARLDEVNAVAAELGGLESSLRPFG